MDARGSRDDCPVTALGHLDGRFWFLDVVGQVRGLTARQLGSRSDLATLFGGDVEWMMERFPKKKSTSEVVAGETITTTEIIGIQTAAASEWLQKKCFQAGIYGDHIVVRSPGIWSGEDGRPVVHAGDIVLLWNGETHRVGVRTSGQVWAAAAATPRPATPCAAAIGVQLQADIKALWNFRFSGSEIAWLGLLGTAYYGVSVRWRAAGFLIGETGSGKSQLLDLLSACTPLHHYSNDTSKAGIEQAVDGRAMPIYIDESSDRTDQRAARTLLDIVLTATGGRGTQGHRGGADGKVRKVQLAGSIVMAATAPPDMQPQHLGRFVLIETMPATDGADHTEAHKALIDKMRGLGPQLWARALAGYDHYLAALKLFREELRLNDCAPREMDQLGALLAGWWVLTHDGVPDKRGALEGVGALNLFLRRVADVAEDSGPRRVVRYLMGVLVQLDRSTDREPISGLIGIALRAGTADLERRFNPETARRVLAYYGIRVIRLDEALSTGDRAPPHGGGGAGVWFAPGAPELIKLFANTDYAGNRWLFELMRLESAHRSTKNVRISKDMMPQRCVWVSAADLGFDEPQEGASPHAEPH